MKPFDHVNAKNIQQALALLAEKKGKARVIAGGTDLLNVLKNEIRPEYPEHIINIKTIPGLDFVSEQGGAIRIGATTKLKTIAGSDLLRAKCPALSRAAQSIASPQIRNMGTLGGDLCQEVRCWYYRSSPFVGARYDCIRKGGTDCFSVEGDNRYHAIMKAEQCHGVCPSDLATALAALDARAVLKSSKGQRTVAVVNLYTGVGTTLRPGEILTEVQIGIPSPGAKQTFLKFRQREAIDWAIASVATLIQDGQVRIALGGVAPGPVRAREAEILLKDKKIDRSLAERAADIAVSGAKPLNGNAYKVAITRTLVRRALLA
jgi:xanthine dehydrogenase YagS FAD-binding subunit